MTHPVEQHYRNRLTQADADFAALDQGAASTYARHVLAEKLVVDTCDNLVDLGCGTGLILDRLACAGKKLSHYTGVDGLAEREARVNARLEKHGIDGAFVHKPMDTPFEDIPLLSGDVGLFIGVMGFWGYHTNRQVVSLYRFMRARFQRGFISFPMIYAHDQMGDLHIRRWDESDILDLCQNARSYRVEREFYVYW